MSTPLIRKTTIVAPVITEKSYSLAAKDKYVFKVDPSVSKYQIKKAIQDLFKVDVVSINSVKRGSRSVRSMKTGRYASTSVVKKAIVEIKKGQKIDIFSAFKS